MERQKRQNKAKRKAVIAAAVRLRSEADKARIACMNAKKAAFDLTAVVENAGGEGVGLVTEAAEAAQHTLVSAWATLGKSGDLLWLLGEQPTPPQPAPPKAK